MRKVMFVRDVVSSKMSRYTHKLPTLAIYLAVLSLSHGFIHNDMLEDKPQYGDSQQQTETSMSRETISKVITSTATLSSDSSSIINTEIKQSEVFSDQVDGDSQGNKASPQASGITSPGNDVAENSEQIFTSLSTEDEETTPVHLDATPVTKATVSMASEESSGISKESTVSSEQLMASVIKDDVIIEPSLSIPVSEESKQPSAGETTQQGQTTLESASPSEQTGQHSEEKVPVEETLKDVKEFIKEVVDSIEEQQTELHKLAERASKVTPVLHSDQSGSQHNVNLPIIEMGGQEVKSTTTASDNEISTEKVLSEGGETVESTPESSEQGEGTEEPQEEFPSFGEWTAKVLAEEEKSKQEMENLGNMPGGAVQQKSVKQSRNNYASRECGAKILATNPEAKNTKSILNGNKDDYMTNPCSAKKWFIIELCEPIQVRTFELASFELFSSQPRTFKVHLSDRYPAKEWRVVGTFQATEERATQSFQVEDEHFSKFVKVEMVDHFREEHFCPLTLFRVFGVDLNYMTDDDDNGPDGPTTQDPDSGDLMVSHDTDETEVATNLFESAKDTVISLVKKVLKVEKPEEIITEEKTANDTVNDTMTVAPPGDNVTSDRLPGPCVPDVQVPNSSLSSVNITSDNNNNTYLPDTPYPTTTFRNQSGNMVIKLEDHEQPPSQDWLNKPLVSLIDMNYLVGLGNEDLVNNACKCGSSGNHTEARQYCRFLQLIFGHQSCSLILTAEEKQKDKKENLEGKQRADGEIKSPQSSVLEEESKSLPPESEVPDDTASSSPESENTLDSSSSEQDFVIVPSPSQNVEFPISDNHSPSNSDSSQSEKHSGIGEGKSEDIVPSATNAVNEEIDVKPSHTVTEASDGIIEDISLQSGKITYDPQPAEVVIPTPSQKDVLSAESNSNGRMTETVSEPPSKASSSDPIELEPSYKSLSSDVLKENILEESLSATTTPELPSLAGDETVSLAPSGDILVKEGGIITDDSSESERTEPPAEVTQDVVEETVLPSQDERRSHTANVTDIPNGNEPTKDLNLIRVPVSPHMKRETAIMRLNNRLKSLEVNVSLSSRFLEELSKRYRKQSEEVMKLLNKTISKLNTTTRLVEDKDQQNKARIFMLEARIDNLTSIVSQLVENVGSLDQKLMERNFTWVLMEAVIVGLLMLMSWRRNKTPHFTPELQRLLENMPTGPGPPTPQRRRNSSSGTVGHSTPHVQLVKHSSESALDVQTEFHIVEPLTSAALNNKPEGNKKKKRKKQKNLESKFSQDSSASSSKEASPLLTSSSDLFPYINDIVEEEFRMIDSCPSHKPRSFSHSGPISSLTSDSVSNGGGKKWTSDGSSCGSSTSLSSVRSDKSGRNLGNKPPLKSSQSAKRLSSRNSFPLPPAKVSKSLSHRSLVNKNFNGNAATPMNHPIVNSGHSRTLSDGNVIVNLPLSSQSLGKKQQDRDGNVARALDAGKKTRPQKQHIVTTTPETLHATNSNISLLATSLNPVTTTPPNPSEGNRKWTFGCKFISIK